MCKINGGSIDHLLLACEVVKRFVGFGFPSCWDSVK
jgi:hypothetical protein